MRENNKIYGFVISMYEFKDTITTLWDKTRQFVAENSQFLHANNSLDFLVDGARPSQPGDKHLGNGDYNLCHFWSNFEIASLEFYRSEAYSKYFEFLDSTGGFFYERWGDAPVHTIGFVQLSHSTPTLSYEIRSSDMAILELGYSPLRIQFTILRTLATRIHLVLAAHRTTSHTLADDACAIEIEISTQIATHAFHDGGKQLALTEVRNRFNFGFPLLSLYFPSLSPFL